MSRVLSAILAVVCTGFVVIAAEELGWFLRVMIFPPAGVPAGIPLTWGSFLVHALWLLIATAGPFAVVSLMWPRVLAASRRRRVQAIALGAIAAQIILFYISVWQLGRWADRSAERWVHSLAGSVVKAQKSGR